MPHTQLALELPIRSTTSMLRSAREPNDSEHVNRDLGTSGDIDQSPAVLFHRAVARKVGQGALKPNPALGALKVLVGNWKTAGTHPYLPGKTLHGRTTFEWIEGGAFLAMRSEIDEPEVPSGIAIFGSDDATGACYMLYFDERDVSRKYDVHIKSNGLEWQRRSPELSQRMVLAIGADGNTVTGKGEMSRDGGTGEPDLEIHYSRIEDA